MNTKQVLQIENNEATDAADVNANTGTTLELTQSLASIREEEEEEEEIFI